MSRATFTALLFLAGTAFTYGQVTATAGADSGTEACNASFGIRAEGDSSTYPMQEVDVDLGGQYQASNVDYSGSTYTLTVSNTAQAASTPGTQWVNATAYDSNMDSATDAYAVSVVDSTPQSSLSASSTSITYGDSLTLTSTITDAGNDLSNQAVDVSTDNSNWTSGWNNWAGTTAWNISGNNVTDTVSYNPDAGTYYYRSRGQDATGALSAFDYVTVTVNKASMQAVAPNSSSYTITAGTSWSPLGDLSSSGTGTGALMWCVSGQTNWGTGSWTAPGTGTYSFCVGQKADSNHYGNTTDPIQGDMETNGVAYTLNVTGTVTFSFSGGPFTYDGSAKSITVTANPSNASFTTSGTSATKAGTYTATATGTGNYSGSGSYTWTINPAPVSFSFSGGPNYTYDGTTKSVSVSVSPSGASYSQSGTYNAVNAGNYTATATATGNYSGSSNYNWSITAPTTYTLTTTVSPAGAGSVSGGGTYNSGTTATVTATAGSGYVFSNWSGAASGTSNPTTVTMNANLTVTANFTATSQNDTANQNHLNIHLPN